MKTSILALAMGLAFTFTPTPAAGGLSNQTKCDSGKLLAAAKFSQCRIKVDFLALKKGDKLSAEKKTAMEDKCDTKINEAFVKLEEKYPDAGDDKCSTYGDAANMIAGLVAVSDAVADGSVSTGGSGAVDPTANDQTVCEDANGTWENDDCTAADPTSDNQSVCEDANGTWDEGVCTPAAMPDRDCFRAGACGTDGWDFGLYAGLNISSTGCSDTLAGSDTYRDGRDYYATFVPPRPLCP